MGYRGHCKVRPVHVAGLVKRYRQLLGEKRHVETYCADDGERLSSLANAISALADSLLICEPGIKLPALKPIAFRLPAPLPGASLTRAVLTSLRLSQEQCTPEAISAAIVNRHGLHFTDQKSALRFDTRVKKLLYSLCDWKVIHQSNNYWSV